MRKHWSFAIFHLTFAIQDALFSILAVEPDRTRSEINRAARPESGTSLAVRGDSNARSAALATDKQPTHSTGTVLRVPARHVRPLFRACATSSGSRLCNVSNRAALRVGIALHNLWGRVARFEGSSVRGFDGCGVRRVRWFDGPPRWDARVASWLILELAPNAIAGSEPGTCEPKNRTCRTLEPPNQSNRLRSPSLLDHCALAAIIPPCSWK